jgi:hypothetical protein
MTFTIFLEILAVLLVKLFVDVCLFAVSNNNNTPEYHRMEGNHYYFTLSYYITG